MTRRRALLLILAGIAGMPAQAACTSAAQFSFLFANQPAATLAYGSSYSYTATSGSGATRGFTMATTQNGLSSSVVNSVQLPAIGTLITGPDATKRDLVLGGTFSGRTTSLNGATRVITVTFTFAQPVRDFAVTLHDVDFASNQYRDWISLSGASATGSYVPAMTTPYGNTNATPGARTATGSSVTFGPGSTPLTLTAAQAAGSGAAGNNADTGTINARFAQPVTSVTLRYGNAPYVSGESTTGQQGVGIAGIAFCPMPEVTAVKSSAPVAGTLGAFNVPGNDLAYTLSVTNSGASPVDAGTIVLTDLLPPGVIFRNTVMDAASGLPLTVNAGTSGLSLTAAAVSYTSDGGATWAYVPAPGYDPAVNGIRIAPTGAMAANSTFAVSFVTSVR